MRNQTSNQYHVFTQLAKTFLINQLGMTATPQHIDGFVSHLILFHQEVNRQAFKAQLQRITKFEHRTLLTTQHLTTTTQKEHVLMKKPTPIVCATQPYLGLRHKKNKTKKPLLQRMLQPFRRGEKNYVVN